jgi:ATP-dependent DNA ligase
VDALTHRTARGSIESSDQAVARSIKDLLYAGKVRNGFVPATRQRLFESFRGLERAACPFKNLPETKRGRWGEGLTAEDMIMCRWLQPRLVAAIEFLEWTPENHLRHSKFTALRDDKPVKDALRE